MCPHGYHLNGFMATPVLGKQDTTFNVFIEHQNKSILFYYYSILIFSWLYT